MFAIAPPLELQHSSIGLEIKLPITFPDTAHTKKEFFRIYRLRAHRTAQTAQATLIRIGPLTRRKILHRYGNISWCSVFLQKSALQDTLVATGTSLVLD